MEPQRDCSFEFHLSKIATLTLMHIVVFKESKRGLQLISYINKNEEAFDMLFFAYFMGFIQISQCFAYEILNIVILLSRPDIRLVLSCYVNVEIIYVVNFLYFKHVLEND